MIPWGPKIETGYSTNPQLFGFVNGEYDETTNKASGNQAVVNNLRDELEVLLITRLNSLTGGSLTVILDNYRSRRLGQAAIDAMADDLMGVVFDKLSPFSANFLKINDYSMHNASLNALRVLYQKYASFFSPEEYAFMISMIKNVYPEERYRSWMKD